MSTYAGPAIGHVAPPHSEAALQRKQEILDEWRKNGTFPHSDEYKQKTTGHNGADQSASYLQPEDNMSTAPTLVSGSEKPKESKKSHRSIRETLKSLRGPSKEEAANMTPEELIDANRNKINFPILSGNGGYVN